MAGDSEYVSDIAFTKSVKEKQAAYGSRDAYARMEQGRGWQTKVTSTLADFAAELDMFYLGTANAEGQPYIQYRGGPTGFLRVLDERTLGFADFAGNQQFISSGNLAENPQAFLFLMDYQNRRRIKVWGNAQMVEGDDELMKRLAHTDYEAVVERAVLFHIKAWDINCPQHIHPRIRLSEVEPLIASLQAENELLKSQLEEQRRQAP